MAPLWHLNFDIDQYINPRIPAPPWEVVPYRISYLLGHRKYPPEKKYGNLLLALRALFGVFASLVLIQLLSHQIPWVAEKGPRIVASFGAAAVLEFCAFESPFAQPRNFIVSQIIASVVGVSLSKLFQLRSDDDWIRWLGGALACALTTVLMDLTKTIHPPAGATALIAVIDDNAVAIGWKLIPLVLLGCSIMLVVALALNNVFTRFPVYWWTASDLAAFPTKRLSESSLGDEESGKAQPAQISILRGEVVVPEHIQLSPEEKLLLEQISGLSGSYYMTMNNTPPEKRRFESLEAQAWSTIRDNHHSVANAAKRLDSIATKAQGPLESESESSRRRLLSAFERFPEEVLIGIMGYLDYTSLYNLSQTTSYFLRLSFDNAFESDPSWRTFRHTVDRLSDGPRGQFLNRSKLQAGTTVAKQGSVVSKNEPEPSVGVTARRRSRFTRLTTRAIRLLFNTEDESEGETMHEFMARSSKQSKKL
ncbi:hypothetical protein NUW58_g4310 [Xylaria curta]|uniref:Uncharacterized protein n=1 Tax=Xylaria curta TaxID=42375 RepID=A0ACC1P986_9PEZI|nr:hypothetical protein NUW58_g4310 [Xylaria curta]